MKKFAIALAVVLAGVAVQAAAPVRTASLSWTAVTMDADGSPLQGALWYNVYRGINGGAKTKIAANVNGLSFTDSGLLAGNTYTYHVTAENSAGEGPPSVDGSKSFPLVKPASVPTLTVQ